MFCDAVDGDAGVVGESVLEFGRDLEADVSKVVGDWWVGVAGVEDGVVGFCGIGGRHFGGVDGWPEITEGDRLC